MKRSECDTSLAGLSFTNSIRAVPKASNVGVGLAVGCGLGVAVGIGVSVAWELTIMGVAVGATAVGVAVFLLAFAALATTRISTTTPMIIQVRRLSFLRGGCGGGPGGIMGGR